MSEEQQVSVQDPKKDEIETNLAKQRQMYERKLEQERLARQQIEQRLASIEAAAQQRTGQASRDDEDDAEDDEPYVDRRKLNKELNKFKQNMEQTIDQKAEAKASALLEQERANNYLRDNPDFEQVMNQDILDKFAQEHPGVARSMLRMPDGFERQKLVYETIKALGVNKTKSKEPSIQEKIDANRKSPYYQPSNIGTAPYASQGDFSPAGKENAYKKMQELKSRLRI